MSKLEMLCSFKGIFYTDSSLSMSYYSAEDGESTSQVNLDLEDIMTANQLQYMANVETQRHNEAYEQETVRHDQQMEAINNTTNEITERRLVAEQEWRDKDRALTERIEMLKLEQNEKQLAVNAEYLALEQEKVNNDALWKANDSSYKQQLAENEKAKTNEMIRHNEEQEKIGKMNVYSDLLGVWTNYEVGTERNANETKRISNDYELGKYRAETDRIGMWNNYRLGVWQTTIHNEELLQDKKFRPFEVGAKYFSSFLNAIN